MRYCLSDSSWLDNMYPHDCEPTHEDQRVRAFLTRQELKSLVCQTQTYQSHQCESKELDFCDERLPSPPEISESPPLYKSEVVIYAHERKLYILNRYPRASVIALLGLGLAVLTAVTLATHGAILPFMPFLIKGLATALGAPMISATACHSIGLGFGLFCAVSSITWAARGMVSQSTINKHG